MPEDDTDRAAAEIRRPPVSELRKRSEERAAKRRAERAAKDELDAAAPPPPQAAHDAPPLVPVPKSKTWANQLVFPNDTQVAALRACGYASERVTHFVMVMACRQRKHFVAHVWQDAEPRKVEVLREILFIESLFWRAVTLSLVLTVLLLPLGAVARVPGGVLVHHLPNLALPPWWLPAAMPATLLVILLAWGALGWRGSVPMPWSISPTSTIWIDRPAMGRKRMGDEGQLLTKDTNLAPILKSCDRFIGLVSKDFFQRLWCVYELALFVHVHGRGSLTNGRVLLLSLEWPSCFHPFKAAFAKEELTQLRTFSCRQARCFKPADRADVLSAIREVFGSEQSFDAFVRTDVLELLERSQRNHSIRLLRGAWEALMNGV